MEICKFKIQPDYMWSTIYYQQRTKSFYIQFKETIFIIPRRFFLFSDYLFVLRANSFQFDNQQTCCRRDADVKNAACTYLFGAQTKAAASLRVEYGAQRDAPASNSISSYHSQCLCERLCMPNRTLCLPYSI